MLVPVLVAVFVSVQESIGFSDMDSDNVSANDGVVISWSQCQCSCQLDSVGVSASVVVSWSQLESVSV